MRLLLSLCFLLILLPSCRDLKTLPKPEPVPEADNWWNEEVFYELFVRSFYDSDGDGIGDFQGVIEKMDYLNDGNPNTDTDLGITALWLMPIFDSPSYHGYDVTNYRDVNPDYGTMDDFKQLLAEANNRGIKVVIDFVMNHSSTQHPWFINSSAGPAATKRDWYLWSDTDPGYNGPWGQTVWHQNNSGYYYGVFWGGMPDLNFSNPEVTAEFEEITEFWHNDIGVDGFRIDAVKHLIEEGSNQENTTSTLSWLRQYYDFMKRMDPAFMSVGEVWTSTQNVVPYSEDRMDYCFEFDLASAIINAANTGDDGFISSKLSEVLDSYSSLQYGTFLTNHDQDRIFELLGRDLNKSKLAAGILLSLPGIPYLYYGEEIGMIGTGAHEYIRSPLQWTDGANAGFSTANPWQPINSNYSDYNISDMQSDPNSLWNHYRKLIKARRDHNPLRKGETHIGTSSSGSVFSFLRSNTTEAVLSIHNLSGVIVDNITISISSSNLNPGTYTMTEILSNTDLGTITVDNGGSISSFANPSPLNAYGTYLISFK